MVFCRWGKMHAAMILSRMSKKGAIWFFCVQKVWGSPIIRQ
jgi:hypothetical protein